MEISNVLNASSFSGSINTSGEQLAAATTKPPERGSQQAESTRVQLSAVGQVKSAAAQVETAAAGLPDNKNLQAAAANTAAAQDRRANQVQAKAQQGFSFNGVAAYSRIFSS